MAAILSHVDAKIGCTVCQLMVTYTSLCIVCSGSVVTPVAFGMFC